MSDKWYFWIFIKAGLIVVNFLLLSVLIRFALQQQDVTILQFLKSGFIFLFGSLLLGLLIKICLLLPTGIKKGRRK